VSHGGAPARRTPPGPPPLPLDRRGADGEALERDHGRGRAFLPDDRRGEETPVAAMAAAHHELARAAEQRGALAPVDGAQRRADVAAAAALALDEPEHAVARGAQVELAALQTQVAGDDGEAERGQAARDRFFAAPSQFTPVSIGPVQSEPSFATRPYGRQ